MISFCYADGMSSFFYLQTILGTIFLFGFAFPDEALMLINKLMRQLRQHIVQREGKRAWLRLALEFRKWSINSEYSPELVDEILEEHREKIICEIGNIWADEILGN